jgi:hypothetical protein
MKKSTDYADEHRLKDKKLIVKCYIDHGEIRGS